MTEESLWYAVHEAGHAVCAIAEGLWVDAIELTEDGGKCHSLFRDGWVFSRAIVFVGGPMAVTVLMPAYAGVAWGDDVPGCDRLLLADCLQWVPDDEKPDIVGHVERRARAIVTQYADVIMRLAEQLVIDRRLDGSVIATAMRAGA